MVVHVVIHHTNADYMDRHHHASQHIYITQPPKLQKIIEKFKEKILLPQIDSPNLTLELNTHFNLINSKQYNFFDYEIWYIRLHPKKESTINLRF